MSKKYKLTFKSFPHLDNQRDNQRYVSTIKLNQSHFDMKKLNHFWNQVSQIRGFLITVEYEVHHLASHRSMPMITTLQMITTSQNQQHSTSKEK